MRHKADLHIHTCLSPCADWYMSPVQISKMAKFMKLDMIAITDHNSIHNIKGVMDAADLLDVEVIPGIEIQTKEEAHILGYFENLEKIQNFYKEFEKSLPKVKNDPEKMGKEVVVDMYDDVLYEYEYFLGLSSQLSVDEVVSLIHNFGGLAFASHIDRPNFSIVSQLGFIPPDLKLDGVEVVKNVDLYKEKYKIICCSDAHYIDEIGRRYITFDFDGSIENRGFEVFRKVLEENMIECHKGG